MKKRAVRKRAERVAQVVQEMAKGKGYLAACAKVKVDPARLDSVVLPADCVFTQALREMGVDEYTMAGNFKKLMAAKKTIMTKEGKKLVTVDNTIRLKALELWTKVTGNVAPSRSESKSLSLDANLSDDALDELLGKVNDRSED